jgi:hypothetical protein
MKRKRGKEGRSNSGDDIDDNSADHMYLAQLLAGEDNYNEALERMETAEMWPIGKK